MKVKVAGIQMSCGEDREENLRKALSLAAMAAESGARLVCFQPFVTTRWFPRQVGEEFFALAEDENGPTLERLRLEAQRRGIVMVAPLFERDGERFFYTAFVLGSDGAVLGKYRKMHLPELNLWHERSYFSPGDLGYPVFEAAGLRFGVQICWDNFFPEGSRILALGGADIILAPTAAAFSTFHRWETVMAAASIANGVYLLRVNRAGSEPKLDFYGRSFCVDPDGDLLIGPTGMHDGVVLADVDTELIRQVRQEWDFRKSRRPSTYGPLVAETP